MGYIIDHWYGRHSLIWSFWVNLVVLRVLLLVIQPLFQFPLQPKSEFTLVATLGFAVLSNGVLFAWQIIGLLRASDRYLKHYGSMAAVWGVQAGLIVFIIHAILSLLDGWYSMLAEEELFSERMDREHASKYQLVFSESENALSFDGIIALGSTRRLAAMIEKYPNTATLLLNSKGGNIYEARGIAKLVQTNGLDTLVRHECSSACTTILIAGTHRMVAAKAKIGFHQYSIDADYAVLNFDVAAEQERDLAFFKSQSVAADFLREIYASSSDQIWFPTSKRLLHAGFVHSVFDESDNQEAQPVE